MIAATPSDTARARWVSTSTAVAPPLMPQNSTEAPAAAAPGSANSAPPAAPSVTLRTTDSASGLVLLERGSHAISPPAMVSAVNVSAVVCGRARLVAAA